MLSFAHAQEVKDGQFAVISNLKAGVAKIDITPTETAAIKIVGHVRQVSGVRDPLRAGVLILDDGETKAAIVTMDTIGAWEDMVKLARQNIEKVNRRASGEHHGLRVAQSLGAGLCGESALGIRVDQKTHGSSQGSGRQHAHGGTLATAKIASALASTAARPSMAVVRLNA